VSRFTVVHDACELYPAPLRSLLMYQAPTDLFRAKWTDAIHEEWMRKEEAVRTDRDEGAQRRHGPAFVHCCWDNAMCRRALRASAVNGRLATCVLLGLGSAIALGGSNAGQTQRDGKAKELPTMLKAKQRTTAMASDSAWTWGYFFAADKAAVQNLAGKRKQSLSLYRVDKLVAILGKPGVDLQPGASLVRVETAAKLPPLGPGAKATLLFQGVPQHLEYTTKAQRDALANQSRAELPASRDTVTVIIPIRKTAAWWALPVDERMAHFQKSAARPGHTAIGADYVDRIYRKLYHTRYAVENADHDFITYFEFEREHENVFQTLCAKLRDTRQNPEWNFVDHEYEIWMTKVE
jgi:hypothetical protein